MDPYRLTATEVIAQIKAGELTVQQYARSVLGRIRERDAVVKAWAYLDEKYVLEQAERLDKVPVESRGPLHGVPVAIKDVICTKDMPTQFNSSIYTNHTPNIDAACIAILRQAGALLLGKTTTTEFAVTMQGPKTTNPHDPTRTPGGSSSGSGAAVADFQAPIALGTQTGGSIIRPGSFNGLYAFKPTWNSVSREGSKIHSLMLDTIGFYARSVEDLELIADVFALEDDEVVSRPFEIRGAKFAMYKTMVWPEAGPGTVSAMARAKQLLAAQGAQVEEINLSESLDGLPEWHNIITTTDGRPAFLPEYRLAKAGLADELQGYVENRTATSRAEQIEAFDNIAAARSVVDKILGKYDAVIVPSATDEAPQGLEYTGNSIFNKIWTALHVPVMNIPGFAGENGLPVGLSLVAPRYHDRHILAVGQSVGDIFAAQGGWKSAL